MGSVDRLRRRLYSRKGTGLGAHKRRRLRDLSYSVNAQWAHDAPAPKKKLKKNRLLSFFLIGSALFFVGSVGLSAFLFFLERNTVSSENIKVEIQGPSAIKAGEELVLQLVITNDNPTPIEAVDLLVEYPEGARTPGDLSRELPRTRESLESIASGGRVQKTARAVLFGEEDSKKLIKTTIEYRVEGSNAIFYREQDYEITLSNAPLLISVDSVEEISSGQEIELTVNIQSNSESTIEDILLVADYPFGFEFLSAAPQTFAKNNIWDLGDIEAEGKKTIRVRGSVVGENAEERVFRFSAGTQGTIDDAKIETVFVTAQQSVFVERPFVSVSLALNGSSASDIVVSRMGRIHGDVTWFNNLDQRVFDPEIEVTITGASLDERSISAQQGFYDSSQNIVSWNRETSATFDELPPQGKGTVSFSFQAVPRTSGESFRNLSLTLDVTIRGKRISERNVPEEITSSVRRVVKIETDLELGARASYSGGPFSNTGPIPPRAEEETLYTITWRAENTTSPAGDVVVFGMLPSYVRWVGAVSPGSEQVDFNEVGGQVRWTVGSMQAHTAREVSFQVALTPSLSQLGISPVIIDSQRIDGIDTFTTTRVGEAFDSLNTDLIGEPGFPAQGGRVVE